MTIQTTPILGLPYPQSTDSADVPRDIQALAQKLDPATPASGVFIIGEIRFVAVAATPRGWLACDGTAVSRTTYAVLFAAIAGMFGPGDGSTTFNLPDLRGRAVCGAGQGAGLTTRAAGAKWGVETVTLTAPQSGVNGSGLTGSENATHVHNLPFSPLSADSGTHWAYATTTGYSIKVQNPGTGGQSTNHQHALSARNADAAHDNTSPSLAIPAFIYSGV